MSILTSHHVTIPGMTGCGKSHLAESYLSQFPKVVKLDTKGETVDKLSKGINPWPLVNPKELTVVTKLEDLIENDDSPYLIYNPVHDELNPDYYDAFFQWAYYHRNITVWVDEVMEVLDSPQKILKWYKAILTRGRYFDVGLWQLTQRPMGIPPLCISQSTHVFCFDLQLDQDRKKVSDVTGVSDFLIKPEGHNFWYWQSGWRNARLGVLT